MSIEKMKQWLEALESNRQTHYYCEDTWYSCPKHEEGCANEAEGNDCNCGADEANAVIDAAITSLRQAIAEAEKQEPVAWMSDSDVGFKKSEFGSYPCVPLYTSLPQRQWVGLTDDEVDSLVIMKRDGAYLNVIDTIREAEAKLKEKNT